MRTVLISGAGVAGPALAFWLARNGFRPTVVERAQGRRSSGNPVDVRGPAMPVAERMGIVPALRAAATGVTGMRFVGTRVRLPMSGPGSLEVPRADLASLLYEAARDDAEFVFDASIATLTQDPGGVDVTFTRGAPRRFDLVIGADGLHSTTRRLAFGASHIRHLGLYVATFPLGAPVDDPYEVLLYNTPGRLVSVHPGRDVPMAAFIFRSPELPGFDHRDTDQHRAFLRRAYRDVRGWIVPALLARSATTEDLFFDGVSTVTLPSWSTGRVALLGDAAASVSLLGDGSSMAIAGADTLATALASTPDHALAFRRYESGHRRRTEPLRRTATLGAAFLVPRTRPGLATRNLATASVSALSTLTGHSQR